MLVIEQVAADSEQYSQWLTNNPEATLWQSHSWQKFQVSLGREVQLFIASDAGIILASALCVIDHGSFGVCTWDSPRGPLWHNSDTGNQAVRELLTYITKKAQENGAMELTISPIEPLPELPNEPARFTPTNRHVQPQATLILDLRESEEALLAQMHSKARYNIKVAERHGIDVREVSSSHIHEFYTLMKETGNRDAFGIHSLQHYQKFLTDLPSAFLLLAYHSEKVVAGLLGVTYGKTGIYYYGASSYEDRAFMAPYLLQWKAILRCKSLGIASYDFLGISPPIEGERRAISPWEGITAFKQKFGGSVVSYPPEQGIVLKPMLKKLLSWKRRVWR